MKTIPVEQLGEPFSKALEQQDEHEAIRLTNDTGTVAWLLRVPDAMKNTDADLVFIGEGPKGHIHFVVHVKHASHGHVNESDHEPVFGAGRGTLTIISEDDEHLKDFREYME